MNPPRTCGCRRQLHEHGCYLRYSYQLCRCDPCREGSYRRRWRYGRGIKRRYGIDPIAVERLCNGDAPFNTSTAERYAAIQQLTARGLSAKQIAARVGCCTRVIHRARSQARQQQEAA